VEEKSKEGERRIKEVIKKLNNKILGFGNYYKFASCKQDFEKLDAFIRQRLRRYIARNKDSKNKLGNLSLTNEVLKNMGLKSLVAISQKYATKKHLILKKNKKKLIKNGKLIRRDFQEKSRLIADNYYEKAILQQLQKLTKNVKQIKNKVDKIAKKLENG